MANALEARKNATVQAQDVQVVGGQLADEDAADVATAPAAPTDGFAAEGESAADGAAAEGADADGAVAASESSKNRCWFCQASAPELQLRKCRGCLKVRSLTFIHERFSFYTAQKKSSNML